MAKFKQILIEYAEVTEQKNSLLLSFVVFHSEDQIQNFILRAEDRELVWDLIVTLNNGDFDFSDYPELNDEIQYLIDRGDINRKINGFEFNSIGDLVSIPEFYTVDQLNDTRDQLYRLNEYISASRVQHLINICEVAQ